MLNQRGQRPSVSLGGQGGQHQGRQLLVAENLFQSVDERRIRRAGRGGDRRVLNDVAVGGRGRARPAPGPRPDRIDAGENGKRAGSDLVARVALPGIQGGGLRPLPPRAPRLLIAASRTAAEVSRIAASSGGSATRAGNRRSALAASARVR